MIFDMTKLCKKRVLNINSKQEMFGFKIYVLPHALSL